MSIELEISAERHPGTDAPAEMIPPPTAPPTPLLVRAGNFLFRHRDLVSPAVLVTLLVTTRPTLPGGSLALDRVLDGIGLLLTATGQALRCAVIGYAYIVRGGKGRRVYAEALVTTGFFGVSRNPLYLGNLLIYAGLIVVWNSPWMYLLAGPFFLFLYRAIVASEETFLEGKFGAEYERYRSEVPRWLPDLRRVRHAVDGIPFNWRRVLLKDYGTAAAWMLAMGMFGIAERLHFGAYPGRERELTTVIAVMAAVLAAWAVIRWLKLSRRLRA